jgi:hypothetical protein
MSQTRALAAGIFVAATLTAMGAPARAQDAAAAPAAESPRVRLPNGHVDGVVGTLVGPFGLLGLEGSYNSIGRPVPGLLLDGHLGGAYGGGPNGTSGEWARGKAGLSTQTYYADLDDKFSASTAGQTTHGLYVPVEVFHLAIGGRPSETFFNTGLGYRYTRVTEDRWYLVDVEGDFTTHRTGGRSGAGGFAAVEAGGESLFVRVEGGVFHAGSVDDFASTFRCAIALGWHFKNLGAERLASHGG